jgi:Rrf2 family protein
VPTHLPPVLSQTSQYALQALIYLAAHRERMPILGSEMAAALDIPANYLSKIMHTLGREGLVEARRGRQGGYTLLGEPESVTVMDVYAAFDDPRSLGECFLGRPECSDEEPCAAHQTWGPIRTAIRVFMESTTLARLSESAGQLTGGNQV